MTDVVILIISAVDGVQPQTAEVIRHVKGFKVPFVVGINKCDLPGADADKVRHQLTVHDVWCEELGGTAQTVEISAKHNQNIDGLLEVVFLEAEMTQPVSEINCQADGFVVEANIEQGIGASMTALVMNGVLKKGDCFVAGSAWGRVRSLMLEGKQVEVAEAGMAVTVTGMRSLPTSGDEFIVVDSESRAKEVVQLRGEKKKDAILNRRVAVATAVKEKGCKEKCAIIKADTTGSMEAIVDCINNVPIDEVVMSVVRSGVGDVTTSDIELAAALDRDVVIYTFGIETPSSILSQASTSGIEVRSFDIIYSLLDDIRKTLSALLEPEKLTTVIGRAVVQEIFVVKGRRQRHEQFVIAGCRASQGKLRRSDVFRVVRDDEIIHEGRLNSMRQHKLKVLTVDQGSECGLRFARFEDIQKGDEVQSVEFKFRPRTLPDTIFMPQEEPVADEGEANQEEIEQQEESGAESELSESEQEQADEVVESEDDVQDLEDYVGDLVTTDDESDRV